MQSSSLGGVVSKMSLSTNLRRILRKSAAGDRIDTRDNTRAQDHWHSHDLQLIQQMQVDFRSRYCSPNEGIFRP